MNCLSARWGFVAWSVFIAVVAAPLLPAAAGTLYAVGEDTGDRSSSLYRIDEYATNPRAIHLGETGVRLLDIAIDPTTGRGYAVGEGSNFLYDINLSTGQITGGRDTGFASMTGLEFDGSGQLYGWQYSVNGRFHKIDKASGVATPVGEAIYKPEGDIAWDADGTMYGTTDLGSLVRINTQTAAATIVGSHGSSIYVYGLEVDDQGIMYGGMWYEGEFADEARLYTVNKQTGAATLIGPIPGALGLNGLAFTTANVPEPSVATAFAALAVLALSRRR